MLDSLEYHVGGDDKLQLWIIINFSWPNYWASYVYFPLKSVLNWSLNWTTHDWALTNKTFYTVNTLFLIVKTIIIIVYNTNWVGGPVHGLMIMHGGQTYAVQAIDVSFAYITSRPYEYFMPSIPTLNGITLPATSVAP